MDGLFPEMSSFSFYLSSSEKSQLRWGRHRLETDVCVAGHQSADPEAIQNYVKKVRDVTKLQRATDVTEWLRGRSGKVLEGFIKNLDLFPLMSLVIRHKNSCQQLKSSPPVTVPPYPPPPMM